MKNPFKSFRSTFGQRIKFLRELRGDSLQDVATAVGATKPHIWELERGRSKNPGLQLVRALAMHFEVPAAALVEDEKTVRFRK